MFSFNARNAFTSFFCSIRKCGISARRFRRPVSSVVDLSARALAQSVAISSMKDIVPALSTADLLEQSPTTQS